MRSSSVDGEPSIKPVMPVFDRLRNRLRLLARSERGMALPTAIFAMVASLGMASVAVVSSVDSQRGTARDNDSKSAIAAADAGASVALLRLNRYANALTPSTPCLALSGSTLVLSGAAADGWCPEIRGTVGSSAYAYRVSPFVSGGTMSVVATGSDGVVGRRIATTFRTTTVGSALSAEGLIGQDAITLSGNADINVSIGTNGDVNASGNAVVCGNIRYGVGRRWTPTGNARQGCGYTQITSGNVTLPPVITFMPPDTPTNNSNYRLAFCTRSNPPAGCQSDALSGRWSSTSPWNPDTRSLSLSGRESLTLTGGDYWMCSLTLSGNSILYMGLGAHVRIFFDRPENCGTSSQISISGNNSVRATGNQPGRSEVPGFYLLGSLTGTSSSVSISGNGATNEMIIYGPNTDISISGNGSSVFKGVIAGKTVTVSGNGATITQDPGFQPPQIGGATLYQRQSYVECTGASASPPNANC